MGRVHTTQKILKTDVSLWKRIKCFPPTLRRRNWKNAPITGHFEFVFGETSGRKITWLSLRRGHCFQRAPFSIFFLSTRKQNACIFTFLWLKSGQFQKAPFSCRISVDGRPNCRNKAAFSWRISVDGRPNRRNKAALFWRISVSGSSNRRNKAAFLWRISVDGRPNRRNKASFSWRISVDGKPNRRNKAAFSDGLGLVYTSDGSDRNDGSGVASGVRIGRKFWSSVNRHDGSGIVSLVFSATPMPHSVKSSYVFVFSGRLSADTILR